MHGSEPLTALKQSHMERKAFGNVSLKNTTTQRPGLAEEREQHRDALRGWRRSAFLALGISHARARWQDGMQTRRVACRSGLKSWENRERERERGGGERKECRCKVSFAYNPSSVVDTSTREANDNMRSPQRPQPAFLVGPDSRKSSSGYRSASPFAAAVL